MDPLTGTRDLDPPLLDTVVGHHFTKWRLAPAEQQGGRAYGPRFEVRHAKKNERFGYIIDCRDGTYAAQGLLMSGLLVQGFATWRWAAYFLVRNHPSEPIDDAPDIKD
ncbi:hypothetical protein ACWEDZ_02845 [Streptomyces sp. NPDC005047]